MRLDLAVVENLQRIGVQVGGKVLPFFDIVGIGLGVQIVVQADLGLEGMGRRDPMQRAPHLATVGRTAAPRLWIVGAAQLDGRTAFIPDHLLAGDIVGMFQAHLASRSQAEPLAGRVLPEVILLHIQHPGEGQVAAASRRVLGVVDGLDLLYLPLRVVGDDHPQRVEDSHDAPGAFVQVLAQAVLQQGNVHDALGLGDADALHKGPDRLGRIAPPPHTGERRHPWIVPTSHMAALNELEQVALAEYGVGQVQGGELDLPGVVDFQLVQEPVIEGPMILVLLGAEGVADAFDGIRLAVGPVVHGIDAPLVASTVMFGM